MGEIAQGEITEGKKVAAGIRETRTKVKKLKNSGENIENTK